MFISEYTKTHHSLITNTTLMKKLTVNLVCILCTIIFSALEAGAQLSLSAQLRARSEMRDGQGAPLSHGSKPAVFISQRSRLNAAFSAHRVKLNVSVQDVRVWGQDISQINRTTTGNLVNAPFGGVKHSSTSTFRESGRAGLEFFTQTKGVYPGC